MLLNVQTNVLISRELNVLDGLSKNLKLGKALEFLQSQATYSGCVNCPISPLKSNFLLKTKELEEFSQVSACTARISYGNLRYVLYK